MCLTERVRYEHKHKKGDVQVKVLTVMLVAAFLTSATFAQCPAAGSKKEKKTDKKAESCCEKTEKKDSK